MAVCNRPFCSQPEQRNRDVTAPMRLARHLALSHVLLVRRAHWCVLPVHTIIVFRFPTLQVHVLFLSTDNVLLDCKDLDDLTLETTEYIQDYKKLSKKRQVRNPFQFFPYFRSTRTSTVEEPESLQKGMKFWTLRSNRTKRIAFGL